MAVGLDFGVELADDPFGREDEENHEKHPPERGQGMVDGMGVDDGLEVGTRDEPRLDAVELRGIGEESSRFGGDGTQESVVGSDRGAFDVGFGDNEDAVVRVVFASQ